ncbi:low-affinity Fe(2+) transport protein [Aspergillus wentii]|nr:low-affinity Fe(2+) transport protein [Aspergillus wentii]
MSSFRKLGLFLGSPGRGIPIQASAPLELPGRSFPAVEEEEDEKLPIQTAASVDLEGRRKLCRTGRLYDKVTNLAGTRVSFCVTLACLVGWGIAGGLTGAGETWQIVLQDASSIQCYFSDSLLMRQQQINYSKLLMLVCRLRSRGATCCRVLEQAMKEEHYQQEKIPAGPVEIELDESLHDTVTLPAYGILDHIGNFGARVFGSVYAFIIYWAGIIVWIAMGPGMGWGDLWQLYVNTATAAELTFTSMFLQNTRYQHMKYLEKCHASILDADCEMERRVRHIKGDTVPNPMVEIPALPVTRGHRAIDYYAAIVGTGTGLVISSVVFAIWIGIGNLMSWNSNWWLIIGTYTGLVGFLDGFVLRSVYFRENIHIDEQFQILAQEDAALYEILGIREPGEHLPSEDSLQYRISRGLGYIFSQSYSVLASLIVIVALICVASGLKWSETGQLLCNTPTMIIEGFLLLVLIEAHNVSHRRRRAEIKAILVRRLRINARMKAIFEPRGLTPGQVLFQK